MVLFKWITMNGKSGGRVQYGKWLDKKYEKWMKQMREHDWGTEKIEHRNATMEGKKRTDEGK